MKKIAVIYHRSDFDGLCSYAVIRHATRTIDRWKGYRPVPLPYTYGDDIPGTVEEADKCDCIAIADITMPPETMKRWHDGTKPVIWIDHHLTSIRDSVTYGYDTLEGIRTAQENGACELTWRYFTDGRPCPAFIRYLALYDVFNKTADDWENNVVPFQYALRDRCGLDARTFCHEFDMNIRNNIRNRTSIEEYLHDGRIIYNYLKKTLTRCINEMGFPVTVGNGHKAVCGLTVNFGSIGFEKRLEREGAHITICANKAKDGMYRIAMYGDEQNRLNLGEYLKTRYDGGGHFNAAGALLTEEQFVRLISEGAI